MRIDLDLTGVPADLAVVDALARLHRVARQEGHVVRLISVSPELRELIELVGLTDVLILG